VSLAPAARLELGNLAYESHLTGVQVTLGTLPAVSSCRATLPLAVQVDAAPGDKVKLELDGGEGSETVLTGTLRVLRRTFGGVEALAADGSADLAALRPAATYEKQQAGDVISALARDAGADTGAVDVGLRLAAYVAHQERTAGEHAAYLAGLAGCTLVTDADGAVVSVERSNAEPEVALRYGRELTAYEVSECPPPVARRIAIGAGPAGSAEAQNALRPSAKGLPDGAALRTPGAASDASAALDAAAAAGATRLRARGFLLPALRPGAVIEIQDVPEPASGGPWLLLRVRHELPGSGPGETVLEGVSAGDGGLGGLLALVGGLL
jgi:hypothetical protein